MDGAGDPADLVIILDDGGAVIGNAVALEHEAGEQALDLATVLDPRDDLLADVAPFRVAHHRLERNLGKQHGLVDVVAVPGDAGLHAKGVQGREADGAKSHRLSGFQEPGPDRGSVLGRHPAVKPCLPGLVHPKDPHHHPVHLPFLVVVGIERDGRRGEIGQNPGRRRPLE